METQSPFDFTNIFTAVNIFFTVIAIAIAWWIYMLGKPTLVVSGDWAVSGKQIYKPNGVFNFYGITVNNVKRWYGTPSAEFTPPNIVLWNSDGSKSWKYRGRLWDHRNSGNDPLMANESNHKNIPDKLKRTVGAGDYIDIVIAYNPVGKSEYYRHTIESDSQPHGVFPVSTEKLEGSLPFYAQVNLFGNRFTDKNNVKLMISSVGNMSSHLKITIVKKFPFE